MNYTNIVIIFYELPSLLICYLKVLILTKIFKLLLDTKCHMKSVYLSCCHSLQLHIIANAVGMYNFNPFCRVHFGGV